MGSHVGGMGPDETTSLPSYLSQCVFFFISLVVGELFCWSSGHSERAVAHVVIVLECPWEHLPSPPS